MPIVTGLFWPKWGLILLCTVSFCWATRNQTSLECCKENTRWNHSTTCTDGNVVRLNCPFGFYEVSPTVNAHDKFMVYQVADEYWLNLIHDDHKFSSDKFCLTTTSEGESIALLCFGIEVNDDQIGDPVWRSLLFCTLSIVSAISLVSTIVVYAILPELREVQDKAMLSAVSSLTVGYIILSMEQVIIYNTSDVLCMSLAFLLYYSFMCAFFWMNIVSFNIWRMVWFKTFLIGDKTLFRVFCAVGWGGPTILVVVTLVAHLLEGEHIKPGFGIYSCWFAGYSETWLYFYGPIAFLLSLNVLYFALTSWRLWREHREYSGNKLRALRFKCLLYLKLILVMGVTWVFELLSFATDARNKEYWLVTDIFNTLQGFVIFLLLVATRKRVRKLLAKKKPCGIKFPSSWIAYEDEECEELQDPDELELSQRDL
ncbi:G-protein coupled receptor Mth2-like isoform X2 [Prorops nasuta]|uniref:G-protein coupled receptor Mth2-like isoform X2 n=1 Tax=Prorops nasuta TaxID=863751 RepID=UPI0034CE0DCF